MESEAQIAPLPGQAPESPEVEPADSGSPAKASPEKFDDTGGAKMNAPAAQSGEGGVLASISSFFGGTPSAILAQGGDAEADNPQPASSTCSFAEDVHNNTIFSKIANDDRFQNFTLGIIVINALWIGVDTEWNHAKLKEDDGSMPLDPGSTIVENLFCTFFTFEVTMRFLAFRRKKSCFFDGWFVFDSTLVFFMILETWVLKIAEAAGGGGGSGFLSNFSALRLMRLLRLTRMARLMQAVPELMMLIKGMISATKSVGFIIIFLVLVMYVFAIIMVSAIAEPGHAAKWEIYIAENPDSDPDAKHIFGSMGDAMMTLFTNGVLGDNLNWVVATILAESIVCMWIFWVFFGISSMTLLNMLIGVLCECIGKKAEEERTSAGDAAMRITLSEAFQSMDSNEDGMVTAQEWEVIRNLPHIRQSLLGNGIEPDNLDNQLDKMHTAIFKECKKTGTKSGKEPAGLSLEEFVGKLLEIQPCNPASSLELQLLRSKVLMRDGKLEKYFGHLEAAMSQLLGTRGITFKPEDYGKSENNGTNNLISVPTQDLFKALRTRTSPDAPTSTTSSPMILQSAFPTPEATPVGEGVGEEGTGILHEDRVLARHHPLFQQLVGRTLPGGWASARYVASLVEKKPLTFRELSQQAPDLSVPDLQTLLHALPELFVLDSDKETVASIAIEEHVSGCPRNPLSKEADKAQPCQCVWRLCDALLLFTEGSKARQQPSTPSRSAAEGAGQLQ